MGEFKTKRGGRRVMKKAANSPEPSGPACGHGGCETACKVRYVGPTSQLRDHHILHAAKGVTNIWTAAVVTGFALVLTGAIAFNAAQAATDKRMNDGQQKVKQDLGREIGRLNERVNAMNATLERLVQKCAPVELPPESEE